MTKITIHATIHANIEKVWKLYTEPEHITKWNNASDDWHTPWAKNDLKVGGKFTSRMEAKDGSVGFDFGGTYTKIQYHELIEYAIDGDSRKVHVKFESHSHNTTITTIFDAETENPVEMQRAGWQAILNNFKKYVESE